MKVGARITIATSALVTATLGAYTLFDLRATANARADAVEREARRTAVSLRASIESTGVATALRDATGLAEQINRATVPWRVTLLPMDAADWPPPSRSPGQRKRLETLKDWPPELHLQAQEGDEFIYVVPLRTPAPRSPTGYKVVGALELTRSIGFLNDEFQSDLASTLLILAIIAVLTTLAITWLTSSVVTRPMEKLLAGIDDVAQGDLSGVLLSERDDEIGALATRFNEMTRYLRESRAETQRQNKARIDLEQRLRQTEKIATIGLFAAEIAHEVGTPLNVIAARARGLAKKALSPEAVQKNAAIITEQTARITRIIQETLDRARHQVGTSDAVKVDLNEMTRTTMELYEGTLTAAHLTYELHRAEGLPTVKGIPDRLQQVLTNLLNNAIQAMPDGGTLRVTTYAVTRRRPGLERAPEQEYAVVEVADSGAGIAPEKREQIFEPFYTSRHAQGGTGLGLSVCYSIVRDHDGWISVDDASGGASDDASGDASGGGAVFAVYLPAGD